MINARLSATGYGGPAISTGIYPNPVVTTNLLAKIDHQFSARDHFSIRYSRYVVDATNARGAGGLSAPTASSHLDNADQSVAIGNTLVLSSRTFLETRAQIARGDLLAPPSDLIGPSVSIAGVATFGTSSTSPTGRLNHAYQVVNNLSHQRGAHALRAGIDFLYNDDLITFPRSVRGSYTFSSLATFLTGVYNNAGFSQTFGITELGQTNPNLGLYVQDEWKLSSSVTLNAGVRYDLQWLESITTDDNNLSPRVGVAWTPAESRRTIVRGSAGLFYDRVPLRALANALMSAGNTTDVAALRQYVVSLSPTQAGAPVFPNILGAAVPLVTLPNLTTMDRDLQNASSIQTSVEIEQQLGERTTLGAGYQYLKGRDLLISVNQNVPDLRGLRQQQWLPPECVLREQQPVFVGRRFELSRAARLAVAADHQVRPIPRVVHALEVDEQRRRGVLLVADRSDRSVEGLGAIGQRSAASPGRQRLGAGRRISVRRNAAGLLCSAVQHQLRCDHRSRAPRAGRSSTASSSSAMPAKARRSSCSTRASAGCSGSTIAGSSRSLPRASISPIAPTS